jgi:hypothetical protein
MANVKAAASSFIQAGFIMTILCLVGLAVATIWITALFYAAGLGVVTMLRPTFPTCPISHAPSAASSDKSVSESPGA